MANVGEKYIARLMEGPEQLRLLREWATVELNGRPFDLTAHLEEQERKVTAVTSPKLKEGK